jgi:prepilin-type N-terminal cleavage/methylation domain-containing protein/prepilin-type processing-associated H-X9-DG protein
MQRPGRSRSRAFTLLETLVAISVVAVLLAILIPVLASARDSARVLALQAHQRDVGLVLRQYAYDHADRFPFYGVPRSLRAPLRLGEWDIPDGYWNQPHYWGAYVAHKGYDGMLSMLTPPNFDPPVDETNNPGRPPYAYLSTDVLTYSAFAAPSYWVSLESQSLDDHLPQKWSTIAFPSHKGVLVRDARPPSESGGIWPDSTPLMVCFADGHVQRFLYRDLAEPVGLALGAPDGVPVLTTRAGLLGRDY